MAYKLTAQDMEIAKQMGDQQFQRNDADLYNYANKKKDNKSSFLSSLLPTVGSIGGGVLGTLLAPGIGTAAGGALGGGAGKFLQNLVEGKQDAGEGVLGEAALGTLGGAGKAFKAGKGALNALKAGEGAAQAGRVARYGVQGAQALDGGLGGLSLADKAVKANQANTAGSFLGKLSGKLEDKGANALATQSQGLSGRLASEAPDVFKTMNKYGYKNINDFQKVASDITTSDGALNLEKMNLLANSPRNASLGNWSTDAAKSLNTKVGVTAADKKAIKTAIDLTDKNLQDSMSARLGTSRASKVGEVHPEDAYKSAQELQKEAYAALGNKTYSNALPPQQAKFDVLNKAANDLKERAYGTMGGEALTPVVKQNIIGDLRSRGIDSPVLLKELQGAKTLKDINKIESQFTKASQIAEQTSDASRKGLGSQVNSLRNATASGMVMDAASGPAARLGGGAMLGASGMLSKLGAGGAPSTLGGLATGTAKKMALTQAPFRLPGMFQGDAQAQEAPEIDPVTGMPIETLGTDQGQLGMDPSALGGMDPMGGQGGVQYDLQSLFNDIQAQPQQADTLLALYKLANPENKKESPFGKVSAEKYSLASSGLDGLSQIAEMLQRDPSLLSKANIPGQDLPIIGGYIANASGGSEYKSISDNVLDTLAKARTGAAITKNEEASYQRLLPRAGDSPETIQTKLATLQKAFSPFVGSL